MSRRVCVLGAGMIGLSSAVRLQEVFGPRFSITVIADKFGEQTTSAIAAGSFRPYDAAPISGYTGRRAAVGEDVVTISYKHFKSILESPEAERAGIHKLCGYDIRYPGIGNEPFYGTFLENCISLSESEILSKFPCLPRGCTGSYLETVVISARTHMKWLTEKFLSYGGVMIQRRITHLDELWKDYDIVMNCTGLGAGQLTGDDTIVPSRGQVMRVDNSTGTNTFAYIDNGTDKMPYYIWTPDYMVVGGTKMIGSQDSQVSKEDHDKFMEDCRTFFPWLNLQEEDIIEEVVGFRPSRPKIRLETEAISYKGDAKWLIHNYGHCAHGIGYSWGSAYIAVEMLSEILLISKL